MRISALGYVGFESSQHSAWEDFGPSVLGMALAARGEDGAVRLRVDDREQRLSVHPGDRDRLSYIGWEVASRAEWEAALEECRANGHEVIEGSDAECASRAVRAMFALADPAGLRHEISYGGFLDPGTFTPGRAMSGFVTRDGGLGHLAIIVPDLAAADRFVRDVLGFEITDELPAQPPLTFYHVNNRHHSLALAEVPGLRGIQHLMIEVAGLDDVGTALDICSSEKIEIVATLGRHTNDHMVSFYLRTPGGFDIEYGWGAVTVDVVGWTVGAYRKPSIWGHSVQDYSPAAAVEIVASTP